MDRIDDLRIDLPIPKPRRKRGLPWAGIVIFVLAMVIVGLLYRDRLPLAAVSTIGSAVEVEVITVTHQRSVAGEVTAGGYLEVVPPGPVIVSALVAGRIESLNVVPGDVVAEGDVLATLDSEFMQREAARLASRVELAQRRVERSRAGSRSEEVDQAAARLANAEAKLEFAHIELGRSESLFEKGVIAQQELDSKTTGFSQANADVAAAQSALELLQAGTRPEDVRIVEAELAAARADLALVAWDIEQCEITAPISGTVFEQLSRVGDWVATAKDDPASAALLSIFDPSQVQCWVDVNQRDSAGLFVGQHVRLVADAAPARVVDGQVSRIMPQANLQKNTLQVKVSIAEPPADFRPELSVKVIFLPEESDADGDAVQAGIPVPSSAIVVRNGETGVFVVMEGKAAFTHVTVSGIVDDMVLVESGVTAGDVVVENPANLNDNQAVSVKEN